MAKFFFALTNSAVCFQLETYCKIWKLEVNASKTKVCIFSKKKVKSTQFIFNNANLEVVYIFKYLGLLFKSNGNFVDHKKYVVAQGSKAMFSILNKKRKLGFTIDTALELFDKLVFPIASYGCEVWAHENCDIVEKLHTS